MTIRNRTTICGCIAAATFVMFAATAVSAANMKLKMHTFGAPRQPETKEIFEPLNADFIKHSNGTLSFQTYFGMSLGGKASDLIAQCENGVVEMSYTLPAYHAGRFPVLTGLELPFIGSTGEVMSQAAWDWYDKYAHIEFKNLKLISLNAIDVGVLHTTKTPVRKMEDLAGLKIRVAGRYIGLAVQSLGGVPVQMPLPAVYESLSRGQTQGMMIPWWITVPFKLAEVTKYHTDVPIYNSLLMIVMNKPTWEKLDAVQKKAVEMSTGKEFAKGYGKRWDEGAETGRKIARDRGNEFIQLSADEEARWKKAAGGAHEAWIKDMNDRGHDGKQMFADLQAIIAKYKH